jgi:hypothetical protein
LTDEQAQKLGDDLQRQVQAAIAAAVHDGPVSDTIGRLAVACAAAQMAIVEIMHHTKTGADPVELRAVLIEQIDLCIAESFATVRH